MSETVGLQNNLFLAAYYFNKLSVCTWEVLSSEKNFSKVEVRFGSSWYDPFMQSNSFRLHVFFRWIRLWWKTLSHLVMMYLQYKRVVIHFRFPDAFILINDYIHIVVLQRLREIRQCKCAFMSHSSVMKIYLPLSPALLLQLQILYQRIE